MNDGGSDATTDDDDDGDASQLKIMLVHEAGLEGALSRFSCLSPFNNIHRSLLADVKAQYAQIYSTQIYSLSAELVQVRILPAGSSMSQRTSC